MLQADKFKEIYAKYEGKVYISDYADALWLTNRYEAWAKEHEWYSNASAAKAALKAELGISTQLWEINNSTLKYPSKLVAIANDSYYVLVTDMINPDVNVLPTRTSGEIANFDYRDTSDRDRSRYVREYSTRVESVIGNQHLFKVGSKEKAQVLIEDSTKEAGYKTVTDTSVIMGNDKVFYHSPFYGIELEVIKRKAAPSNIEENILRQLENFAILKSDSSVGDKGFEIVTVPASLKAHKEGWKAFFEQSAKHLRSWNTGKCGIHIHISRKAFSLGHMERFIHFMNDPKNLVFIEDLSGRGNNHFAQPVQLDKKLKNRLLGLVDARRGEKYRFVNTNPAHTIEVRCFRGNVKKEGFMKCLEFIDSLYWFTRDAKVSGSTKEEYFSWLDSHDYGYGNLKSWLANKGYTGNNINLEWRQECA